MGIDEDGDDYVDRDVDLYWDNRDDDDGDEWGPERIRVQFITENGQAKGRIVEDVHGKTRSKIVFPARGWMGAQPNDGEVLTVLVVHETKPEDPRRGAMFVERILPKVRRYHGAQCGKCEKCPTGMVRVIPRSGSFRRLRYPVCETCGTIHELPAKWL